MADAVNYDLAEVRDLDYYTGITFEGFAPGLGVSLISGGRYDDLIGHFGPAQPAVGWALTLDQVLVARELQGVRPPEPVPHVLLSVTGQPGVPGLGRPGARTRAAGGGGPAGLEPEALWGAAQARGIGASAWPDGAARLLVRDAGRRTRQVASDAWEEVATWLPLTIALPKGRLTDDALAFLARAGYELPANGDKAASWCSTAPDGRLRFMMAKPSDVPVFVEYGAADLGIAGLDVVREAERDVYEPLRLPFGYCRLVLAGRADRAERPLRLERSPKVATKFPRLTEAFFRQRGLAPEIIVMSGSVELAPLVGLADLIVDLVQTGMTLRENGLIELRVVLESQAVLIANRASYRLRAVEVRELIDAVVAAAASGHQ